MLAFQVYYCSGTQAANLSIRSQSEHFTSDRIMVNFDWTLSSSLIHYHRLLPNVSVNVVPDLDVILTFIENMSIHASLSYNTLYNVSITQPGICGQPNQTVFIKLNYCK